MQLVRSAIARSESEAGNLPAGARGMGVIVSRVRLRRGAGHLKRDFKHFSSLLWSRSIRLRVISPICCKAHRNKGGLK